MSKTLLQFWETTNKVGTNQIAASMINLVGKFLIVTVTKQTMYAFTVARFSCHK